MLAVPENEAGATLYVRIMTRLRQQETAYATLNNALSASSSSLPVIAQQVAVEGITAATDRNLRARMLDVRVNNGRQGMRAALTEMGNTVAQYFTPEEKTSFALLAQKCVRR